MSSFSLYSTFENTMNWIFNKKTEHREIQKSVISDFDKKNHFFSSKPITSEPVTSEPVTSEPVTSEPVTSEPVTSEPVTSEPVTSEPVTSEPVTSEPVTSEPVTSEPVTPEILIFRKGTIEEYDQRRKKEYGNKI
jgi:hypothetical protein